MSEKHVVRIVPNSAEGDLPSRGHGTKLYVGDKELTGVRKVELIAEPHGLWEAKIYCVAKIEPLSANAELIQDDPNGHIWASEPGKDACLRCGCAVTNHGNTAGPLGAKYCDPCPGKMV